MTIDDSDMVDPITALRTALAAARAEVTALKAERDGRVEELSDFAKDALTLPAIDHALPNEIFKWAATIDAHAKTCIEDNGAAATDKMACIMHNVRDLLAAMQSAPPSGRAVGEIAREIAYATSWAYVQDGLTTFERDLLADLITSALSAERIAAGGREERMRALLTDARASLWAWTVWEADIIENADWRSSLPRLTQDQMDALSPIQEQRNDIIDSIDAALSDQPREKEDDSRG